MSSEVLSAEAGLRGLENGEVSALAVDLGGQHVSCALVSGKSVLISKELPLASGSELTSILPGLAEVLRGFLRDLPCDAPPCAGIAFSFCGLVDPFRNRILSTNAKYSDGADVDLVGWARDQIGQPLRLENDARAALLGERYAGAGQGFDDVVMITLGTGVGGAAMMGGRLLRGKHYQAGCLGGHLCADYRGRSCTCGNIGCVEAEASNWSLPHVCSEHPLFSGSQLSGPNRITLERLFQAAAAGDDCAREIRDRCIQVWASGVVSLIHAYDPEVVILGGGVMNAADHILPLIRAHAARHAWTPWGKVEIRKAALGQAAALLGAVPLLQDFAA